MQDWRDILAASFRDAQSLLDYLQTPVESLLAPDHPALKFPVLVPRPFADCIERGNPADPLLRQILPLSDEGISATGFITDPLGEKTTNVQPGLIHKYQGRVLMLAATACAVNCRYCFRRHFEYSDNRLSRKQRDEALDYVRNDASVTEVILSGGDPLMLQDDALAALIASIDAIPHIRRIRIHTRLPVVIPQRVTAALTDILARSRCDICMVLHINHANELTPMHESLINLRNVGITLLNQSVLLKGVNDDLSILSELSERLFTFGVLPYYLHLPDRVEGTQHFTVSDAQGCELITELRKILPGYLVPKLVREVAGEPYKIPCQ